MLAINRMPPDWHDLVVALPDPTQTFLGYRV
jgi:hypothetical protein